MNRKTVFPIFSAADQAAVQPILEAVKRRGFRVREKDAVPGRSAVVLLFLSKAFAADEELQRRFFAADSAGCAVIPVDLDGAEQNELVRSALMAKNTIAAQGRTAEELAARIGTADAPGGVRLPRILFAAALLLAIGAGLWIWRSRAPGDAVPQEAVPALAENELAAARRLGLTPEDLASIDSFTIVGDAHGQSRAHFTTDSSVNPGLRVYLDDLAYDSEQDGERRWYSTKDGHEFTLTHYDDLSVIELMPNLRSLSLVLVEADRMPSLKALQNLEVLRLENCRLGSLDWAAGSGTLYLYCRGCDIEDFSAVGSMSRLREAEFDLEEVSRADFSGAGAPSLHNVRMEGRGRLREIDLSGLAGCPLWELRLIDLPVRNLDFLSGQDGLQQLELCGLPALRSVEPLRELSALTWLWLLDLPNVNDLEPVGACRQLKDFNMNDMPQIRDLDFLTNCRSLQGVWLNNIDIEDLDFIESMSGNFGIRLSVSGRVGDWSALALDSFYGELRIRPENGSVAAILPYLADCKVGDLEIGNARDLDLAALPEVSSRLTLCDCPNLEDLSALEKKHTFSSLELRNLPRLRSLDGVQKIYYFGESENIFQCSLNIENCPRLEDWSALRGKRLGDIRLKRVFTLPDFGALRYSSRPLLRLESIPGITDLSCLDAVSEPEKLFFSFEIVDLHDLRDLGALRRFRGEYIAVMPELQDLAQALVDAKNFERCEIAYPAGGWDDDGYDEFTLLSLDELDTLSDAALGRVTSLCIAGDRLVDCDRYEVWDNWDGRRHHVVLFDRDSGEETEVGLGGYSDLSALSKLTGLRRLELYAMPLESLDGIQAFGELETLRVQNCPKLTDASAAFTLQGLRHFEVARSPLASIQGVQNCTELSRLFIYETKVRDLSPLRGMDFSASLGQGGFSLSVGGTDCDDYSPIEAIPAIDHLDLNGAHCERWPDLTQIGALRSLSAHGDDLTQEMLEGILRAHPELEELQIPYNRKLSDLTPLLEMENLRYVLISADMNKAAASLEGKNRGFELEIRD